ncbi:glycosyltransferase [Priestia flexa]|uniref:glycosyltransferase n=1 Tax=Priestia flexa TaxID=86664 RepID=UPI0024913D63|nr:glycosyltransferase [Priestia flexa]
MKKRILIVIDSLNSGGAEKSLISLLACFNYQKYKVDLLLFSIEGLYLNMLPKEVTILPQPAYMKKQAKKRVDLVKEKEFKSLYFRTFASLALRNPLKKKTMHSSQILWTWANRGMEPLEQRYDVAIAYSQGMPTYFVAEKVQAAKKLAWVNTDYKLIRHHKKFDVYYYNQFHHIIAVSDSCKEVLTTELPSIAKKVEVIYDIISPTLIYEMAIKKGGFTDLFDGIRILTIGRLVEQKGYDLAIEACYRLKKQGFNIKWYAIGEGSLEQNLKQKVAAYHLEGVFVFLGTYQNPYPFLHQADIYVQPSKLEGYGLAMAEARLLKKPIVATNFPIVYNQLRDRENGLIVKMNAVSLAKGIQEIICDSELKKSVCEKLSHEQVGTEAEIFKVYSLLEAAN